TGQRRACRTAVPGEEDYLGRAVTSRQFPTKSTSFSAPKQPAAIRALQVASAWWRAGCGASAAAARANPEPPPRSRRGATPAARGHGRDAPGTAVVLASPGQG